MFSFNICLKSDMLKNRCVLKIENLQKFQVESCPHINLQLGFKSIKPMKIVGLSPTFCYHANETYISSPYFKLKVGFKHKKSFRTPISVSSSLLLKVYCTVKLNRYMFKQ